MARTPSNMVSLGSPMPTFRLRDAHERWHSNDQKSETGTLVMFMSSHCPFVIHLKAHLAQLCAKYSRELAIFGIMSNDLELYPQDGPEGMRADIETYSYTFPYLLDETQAVAQSFQAACTPDFFLYDSEGRLYYRGQYDGSRPSNDVEVTGKDLEDAIKSLINSQEPPAEQMPSLGCNIKWKPENTPA